MRFPKKWLGASFLLVLVACSLIFPRQGIALMFGLPRLILPFIPLLFYGLVALATTGYLWAVPPDSVQMDSDKQQLASLTLAGFCFTSLSLIVSFFKTEIAEGKPGPENILFYFSFSLACFVASYMALRYRTKHLFLFLSDGLIDSGFWSIIIGLLSFFLEMPALKRLPSILFGLLAFYIAYIALHFYYHVRYVKRTSA